jgi:small subunit ribosomal protein S20
VANIKSAKKEMRKAIKRRIQNSQQKSRLRTLDKKIHTLIAEGLLAEAKAVYSEYTSYMDRAGKKNLVHHKKADRKKSRLALLLNKASA